MNIAVSGHALVWTDSTGAIWTMASDGSTPPKQLSDQHLGFAFSLVVAGDQACASTSQPSVHDRPDQGSGRDAEDGAPGTAGQPLLHTI